MTHFVRGFEVGDQLMAAHRASTGGHWQLLDASLSPVQSVATLASQCATCRATGAITVTQRVHEGHLTWLEQFSCGCGHAFEAKGKGLPSAGVRSALLEQSGRAEVWLDDAAHRPTVQKLLQAVLGVSAEEASTRLSTLPAKAFEGTHAEADFVAQALGRARAVVRVLHQLPGAR